ncbi:hypothetical protein RZN05_00195 [Sphingomonas sp. HF-S4]|uniref:Uncharacterized protein n=1 Tax=Sphingomonas agrestis TaxID=3080540 RepID=A0ABU3Y1Y0_9SPHN|nr:hypothetical protein [Sphingomonas sp. HF-S4]MDV3455385.1 hypothetical protein [Sphingomonas sp. HF-S4]
MSDFVVVDGDQAMFLPAFGAAMVVVQPGVITGSGPATVGGKAVCLEGDEGSVSVPGCMYVAPPYVIPGTGTLEIDQLAGDQLTQTTVGGGTKLILKGSMFVAKFSVNSPAQQPQATGPVPDATPSYSGNGQFVTTNMTVKAA